MAKVLEKCTDCTKVMTIAGDLSHDGDGHGQYASSYTAVLSRGVKILDGLGNHDIGIYESGTTSFNSLAALKQVPPMALNAPDAAVDTLRKGQGWELFDSLLSQVDAGEPPGDSTAEVGSPQWNCPTFADRPDKVAPMYCTVAIARYYTFALKVPGSDTTAAYVVQLHNAMRSKTAVAYLQRIRDKLYRQQKQEIPIIIVGHSFEGSMRAQFNSLLRQLNVAAILYGHYHCKMVDPDRSSEQGHCDYRDLSDELVDSWVMTKNKNNVDIPDINTNAIFHNVFWVIRLDTDRRIVMVKRLNRHHIGDASELKSGRMDSLLAQMPSATFVYPKASAGFASIPY
jgi:hypothetical protein